MLTFTGFALGAIFGALNYSLSRRIFLSFLLIVFNILCIWLFLPTFAFGFLGILLLIIANGLIMSSPGLLNDDGLNDPGVRWGGGLVLATFTIGLIVLPILTSWSFFHASDYRNLIGEVETGVFSTDTSPVDLSQVRRVDQDLATKLAEKRLGEDPGLGSRVDVGKMSIQAIKGKLYWVGALNHSGFGKWWNNSSGTPGYVRVSATNENDVQLVTEVNGKPIKLRYNVGAYWSDDPHRKLYMNGYSTVGLTDWTFEVNDEGYPFYVVTVFNKTIGYAGNDAKGVATLDPQNGAIKYYPIEEAPAWIDRIQPEDFIDTQLDDWGIFVQGWLNSWFGKDDVTEATPGMSLVYGDDGKSYWYTGMKSDGADDSTVGFVLTDTRTKQTKIYYQAGATETAAMRSAVGDLQEKGYTATFPILYNSGGKPTYFMTLKDAEGLVKASAFVSVENYNIVGVARTARQAQRSYMRALRTQGNAIHADGATKSYSVTAKVLRINSDVSSFGTSYYFLLEGHSNKLFVGSVDTGIEITVTQTGDVVKVAFDDSGNESVDVVRFDNLAITLQKTEAQIGVEEANSAVVEDAATNRGGQNADAAWDKLDPADKARIMEQAQ